MSEESSVLFPTKLNIKTVWEFDEHLNQAYMPIRIGNPLYYISLHNFKMSQACDYRIINGHMVNKETKIIRKHLNL